MAIPNDAARKWTDAELEALERRMAREYSRAAKDMRGKQAKWLEKFNREREQRERALDDTKEALEGHKRWLQSQAARGDWLDGMATQLADSAHQANVRAMDMVNGHIPRVFSENANRAAFAVDKALKADTGFTLVNEEAVRHVMEAGVFDTQLIREVVPDAPELGPAAIQSLRRREVDYPKDMRWNRQKFTSAITQGILQGESIPNIVKRTESIYGQNANAAVRAARTAITNVENAGRMSSFERAQKLGIDMEIEWEATLDDRTRESHRRLDGERIKLGEYFETEDGPIRWPGDPQADPAQTWNCRCRADGRVVGFDGERGDWADEEPGERWSRLPEGTTYEQWKAGKAVSRAESYGNEAGRVSGAWYAERAADAFSAPLVPDIGMRPQRPSRADYASQDELDAARAAYRTERAEFDERRESLVQSIVDAPAHGYETRDAATAWAERKGVSISGEVFEHVDAKALDEAIHVTDALLDKYPEVQGLYGRFGGKFEIGVTEDRCFMEANGGLMFNKGSFGTYREAVDSVVDNYTEPVLNEYLGRELSYMVRGDGTFGTSVTHEFGHNVDHSIRWGRFYDADSVRDFDGLRRYESELMELTKRYTTSEYSMTNVAEAFAEGFAEMECNPTSDYGRAFAEFFGRWRA